MGEDVVKPEIKKDIDLGELKEVCKSYIDHVDENGEHSLDNDFDYYIFESAMKSLFGSEVFEWINKKQNPSWEVV